VAVVHRGTVIASGSLGALLSDSGVRVRVGGLGAAAAKLERFGHLQHNGEWISVDGLALEGVPDLVAEIVALGGRVYAVEPRHQSLEDRFMELLGGET
jgi:ABC-2 type transport system ATP-binding protein